MKWETQTARVKIDSGCRIVIPSGFRESMGIAPGDTVLISLEEPGVLSIRTSEAAFRQAQAWLSQYIPPEVSLVDDLIAERRAEAARE